MIRKLIETLTPREVKHGSAVMVLIVGMAFFETIGIASIMPFMALLGNPDLLETNYYLKTSYDIAKLLGISSPDEFLIVLGFAVLILIIISAAYRALTHYAMIDFIETLRFSISARILSSYLVQPYPFFLEHHSGDLTKTVLSEVDLLIANVFRPTYQMFAYALVALSITVLLILVDPVVALLASGILGGTYVCIYWLVKRRVMRLGQIRVRENSLRFLAASEAFGGIKAIKLLGCEDIYVDRFAKPSKRFARTQVGYEMNNQIPNLMIEAVVFGAMLTLTLWLMISSGGLGGDSLGSLLPLLGLYAFAALRLKPALQNIYAGFTSLKFGQAALESVHSDLVATKNVSSKDHSQERSAREISGSVKFVGVDFRYSGQSHAALRNVSMEVASGTSIGIVGATGAGKTTLVDLLLGLLEPTKGSIEVGGEPLSERNLRGWQQNLGYVPQDIYLADTSIAENIALGVPREKIDMSRVVECAQMAQIHDSISSELPQGYWTAVGERGARLSGGQLQRIGIARSLYNDPSVMVFDEATSALDNVTEKRVIRSLQSLTPKKTIVVIAHRLSTVRVCDQIVVLSGGCVNGVGDFDYLAKNNRVFTELLNASEDGA